MEGLQIQKTSLTPEAACRVLETAVEAGHTYGIGYWADIVAVQRGRVVVTDETVIGLAVKDREGNGKCYRLNAGHVERAVSKMLADPKKTESDGWTDALLTQEYPDGPLSDAIVQVACFGKIVYA